MAACRDACIFAYERTDEVGSVVLKAADLLNALKPIKASGVREVTVSLPKIGWKDIGGLHQVKVPSIS
jgi:SpoVK/Ycf46/Vps4 family AAA+-type ATPase